MNLLALVLLVSLKPPSGERFRTAPCGHGLTLPVQVALVALADDEKTFTQARVAERKAELKRQLETRKASKGERKLQPVYNWLVFCNPM